MSMLKEYLLRSPYLLFFVHALRSLLQGKLPFMPALRNAGYDSQTLRVMRRVLRADSIGIDGGAHHGAILEEMGRLAPKARHYAFEPLPELYAGLVARYPDQRVLACALGDRAGRATFQHVVDAPAYSGLQRRSYDHPDPQVQEIHVEVVRLDDLVPESEPIAFIKLDLEGGEYHALRGGVETIRRARPVIVFEAGAPSSGHYGVTPEMIYTLITSDLRLQLSTMARWLAGKPGFDLDTFLQTYPNEFVFIAYP